MRAFTKFVAIAAIVGPIGVLAADDAPKKSVVVSAVVMQENADRIAKQLQEDTRTVIHLRDAARKLKDVIKLNCVNDRLVQINAQRNIADGQARDLQAALGNQSNAQGIYEQLQSTAHNVQELRDEAKACVGEPELYKQESGVEVNNPDIPDDPTTDNPFDPTTGGTDEVEPPGFASPFY